MVARSPPGPSTISNSRTLNLSAPNAIRKLHLIITQNNQFIAAAVAAIVVAHLSLASASDRAQAHSTVCTRTHTRSATPTVCRRISLQSMQTRFSSNSHPYRRAVRRRRHQPQTLSQPPPSFAKLCVHSNYVFTLYALTRACWHRHRVCVRAGVRDVAVVSCSINIIAQCQYHLYTCKSSRTHRRVCVCVCMCKCAPNAMLNVLTFVRRSLGLCSLVAHTNTHTHPILPHTIFIYALRGGAHAFDPV